MHFARPLLLGLLVAISACEPLADDMDYVREEVPIFRRDTLVAPRDSAPARLKVMAWNIKFGAARIDFWFDYWGDRVQMSRDEAVDNLARVCQLIREVDPDVLMTEEIEVDSRRSAYVDMIEALMSCSSLNYAAYFSAWNSRYIPSEGLGRIDMGNAIFSKYPIAFAERIRQPDRTDQSALVKKFYGHRAIGRAIVRLGAREVATYVVHTEAYDQDGTKQKQINQVSDELRTETRPFVIGGDFNELPPTAVKIKDFADEHPSTKGTMFEQPPYTPQVMQIFYDALVPAIPLADYGTTQESQRKYFSHSTLGPHMTNAQGERGFWNRTLDYLFASRGSKWTAGASDVLQAPGRQGITSDPNLLSDHAPVVGTWELP